MITILSYPRSGQNLLKHMLTVVNQECERTHNIRIWEQWPPKKDDALVLIIRDYKECIPRHLYPDEPINVRMISAMFNREYGLSEPAAQYVQNIVIYDIYPYQKHLIYYEDLINYKYDFDVLALQLGAQWPDLLDFDWDAEFQISLDNYPEPRSSGQKDYHKKRIEDIPLLEKLMREMNPVIYNRYLKRYEPKPVQVK